jgi:ATP-dependent RNA helicase RhlE
VRPAATVSHALYPVAQHQKTPFLLSLLPGLDAGPVLVFARTRYRAGKLAQQLGRAGHSVAALHGDRSQGQRQAALAGFKSGRVRILVATDIAARGLDIEGVTHVINYDIPDTTEAYIHRIGRTGRAEQLGDAFTFVTPDDAVMVKAIERAVGQPIERVVLAGFDYAAPAPARGGAPASGSGPRGRTSGDRRPVLIALPSTTGGQTPPTGPRAAIQPAAIQPAASPAAPASSGGRRRRGRRPWRKRGAA